MTSTSHPSDTTSAQRQEGHNSTQIIRPSQHPPSPLPPDTGSPPPSLPATPRPCALAIIEHALRRGDILEIGTTTIRYLRQGEEFQEHEDWFEALQTGLYQRYAVFETGQTLDGPPDHSTWLYLTDLGHYEQAVLLRLDALSHFDRDALLVGITFRTVMLQLQQARAEQRIRSQRRTGSPGVELDCAIDLI